LIVLCTSRHVLNMVNLGTILLIALSAFSGNLRLDKSLVPADFIFWMAGERG